RNSDSGRSRCSSTRIYGFPRARLGRNVLGEIDHLLPSVGPLGSRGQATMLKLCSRCSREAELSVVCVISTVGSSPRRQKCSPAVLFCHRCMRDLLADGANFGTDDLRKSVNTA